ncbi:CLUMA_CG005636, isoform A [Clunio marinus]|uniref:CLUMA_CG005636, isoform A n=1 Tax=Clunio marinus TaxID=568069 RepID=A0A1J1HVG4_9DIPT|nr:CLUMA_CG005636, isoform A [Clunio marinus]
MKIMKNVGSDFTLHKHKNKMPNGHASLNHFSTLFISRKVKVYIFVIAIHEKGLRNGLAYLKLLHFIPPMHA